MHRPFCVVSPFVGSVNEAAQVAALEALAEGAVMLNIAYLAENPETPKLYETDIRYALNDSREEKSVLTIPFIRGRGWGDCLELAAWRCAERRRGGDAKSRVRIQRASDDPRERVFHAVVSAYRGFEDPSALLSLRNG